MLQALLLKLTSSLVAAHCRWLLISLGSVSGSMGFSLDSCGVDVAVLVLQL